MGIASFGAATQIRTGACFAKESHAVHASPQAICRSLARTPAVRIANKAKKVIPEWVSPFLELLPRFELGTSSLPRMCSTN